jgi:hypothetical protein
MKAIINIQDEVLGSWHQITVDGEIPNRDIRLDGTTLPCDFETRKALIALMAAFKDDFAGICDGKDNYLADILANREAEARERKA